MDTNKEVILIYYAKVQDKITYERLYWMFVGKNFR